MIFQIEID